MAKQLGANFTLKVNLNENIKELAKRIVSILGEPPTVTIDCAGNQQSIGIGLEVTAWGGVVVVVGMAETTITCNLIPGLAKELDVRGMFRYVNDYPVALAMVAAGGVDVKQLVTHRFRIEEAVEAFDIAYEQTGNPIKIMLQCNPE